MNDRRWELLKYLLQEQILHHEKWDGHRALAAHIERVWKIIEEDK